MTTNRTRDKIESEMDDLDIPFIPVTSAMILVADHFEIDPLPVLRRMRAGASPLSDEESLLQDIISEGLESTFQIDHILAYLDLQAELENAPEIDMNGELGML